MTANEQVTVPTKRFGGEPRGRSHVRAPESDKLRKRASELAGRDGHDDGLVTSRDPAVNAGLQATEAAAELITAIELGKTYGPARLAGRHHGLVHGIEPVCPPAA